MHTRIENNFSNVLNTWIAIALAISIIALFFIYFFWSHPIADDLARAGLVRELGLIKNIHRDFFNWSGRWSGIGIAYLIPVFFDIIKVYPFLLLSWALINLFSFNLVIALLLHLPLFSRFTMSVALLLYAVFLANYPYLQDSFFWLTGATENILVSSLAIITIYLLINIDHLAKKKGRKILIFFLCLMAFVIPGFHELFGTVFCSILIIGAIVVNFLKKPSRLIWFFVCLCALTGIIFVILAPGNYIRMDTILYPNHLQHDFLSTAKRALYQMILFIKNWLTSPSLLIMTLIFFLWAEKYNKKPKWYNTNPLLWTILIPLCFILVLLGCFLTMSYITIKIPPRTLNGIYMLFLIGWFSSVFVLTRRISIPRILKNNCIITALIISLVFCFLCHDNIQWAIEDMGKAREYHIQIIERDNYIKNCIDRGVKNISIEDNIVWPRIFPQHKDIIENSKDWRSWHWATYFKAKSIKKKSNLPSIRQPGFSFNPLWTMGFGPIEGPYLSLNILKRVRWILGKEAKLRFKFTGKPKKEYFLKLKMLTYHKNQHLEVLINKIPFIFHDFKQVNKWVTVTSRLTNLVAGVNEIVFKSSRCTISLSPSKQRAILFEEISIF